MRKALKIIGNTIAASIIAIVSLLGSFIFTCIIGTAIGLPEAGEVGNAIYSVITIVIPVCATIASVLAFRNLLNPPSVQKSQKIPFSKKMQKEMATKILRNIDLCVSLANEADNVSLFVKWYDEALEGFTRLMKLKKVKFTNPPILDYCRLKDEFQWHLCDAIDRAKENAVSEITKKYKNSREYQRKTADIFESDLNSVRSRFSADTAIFADKAITEVKNYISPPAVQDKRTSSSDLRSQFAQYGGTEAELLTIDLMEGHDFEYWCAQLLTDLGYTNVTVTQASGDHGVDVLAVKDGIKYAVQCKCYAKDLGNGPIQEVNSGKNMPEYRCHVGAVMTNRYFTPGAVAEAEANNVLLWDRDWIKAAIERRSQKRTY